MIEKVNPKHPDKVADRIAGAIVDLAYRKEDNPKIAVEVMLGHGNCHIIIESNLNFLNDEIKPIVERIAGNLKLDLQVVRQDEFLAGNQKDNIRCGDNGIFKGVKLSEEEKKLSLIARDIYDRYDSDGKYILDKDKLIICQSNTNGDKWLNNTYKNAIINPLGEWSGGVEVDTGCTNRKLGSDMGRSVTGGGLHGKDLSKADVALNIFVFKKAQKEGVVELSCAIGDEFVDGISYSEIVDDARKYINSIGGFEKFAEWGLF